MSSVEEIKAKVKNDLILMKSQPIQEAAKAMCRAKCALFDRDPNCQENGRCGNNWEWYTSIILRDITKPIFESNF